MKKISNILLYLAFLWALVVVLVAPGCQTTASQRIDSARRELGSIKPQVEQLVDWYEDRVDRRIKACERKDGLITPRQRRECLGPFAPDSELSMSIDWLRVHYDGSAESLRELQLVLELIERFKDKSNG